MNILVEWKWSNSVQTRKEAVRHTSDLQRFANGVGAGISRAFYSPPPGSRGGWRAVLHSIDHSWRNHFHRVDHGFRTAARGVDQSLRRIGEAFMQALGKRHKDAKTAGEFYGQASLGFVGGGIWDNYKLTPELLGYVGLAEFASEVSFIGMAYSIYNVAAFTYNYYEGYGAYEEISNAAILGMFIAYYQYGASIKILLFAPMCVPTLKSITGKRERILAKSL